MSVTRGTVATGTDSPGVAPSSGLWIRRAFGPEPWRTATVRISPAPLLIDKVRDVAFLLLGPYTAHLPLVLRTPVMTAIVVPVAVHVLVPAPLKADHKAAAVFNARCRRHPFFAGPIRSRCVQRSE
ncbi:hypothetical protein [Streptomyces sp. NPDC001948]